ncbi:hypothetical protein ACE41F_26585 [Bacillus cereus]|uniref:hypothetical protein n=1 Tax=Bacillus cereus TaxID=1396 RepID=UPI0035C9727D
MKAHAKELTRRFLNRGTLLAVSAFAVKQALAAGYIPTQEVADSILVLVDWGLNGLVIAGFVNNAGHGTGFRDKPKELPQT